MCLQLILETPYLGMRHAMAHKTVEMSWNSCVVR